MKLRLSGKRIVATTLVEVVMAVAILGVFIAGIMNCFGYGFFSVELARENQRATQILLEKAESVRLYNWAQVTTPGFIPPTFMDVYDPQSSNAPGITYTGTIAVTNYPGSTSYSANIRQIIVTVNWTTGGRIPHTRSLATLVAKDGEQNYVY
jgi:type II secretory pathway pseudopilin PulG